MRWMLTGEEFDAAEAHRIGLIQEVLAMALRQACPGDLDQEGTARRLSALPRQAGP
jgi:enoyl-CoA hydratase/carnithine racemase